MNKINLVSRFYEIYSSHKTEIDLAIDQAITASAKKMDTESIRELFSINAESSNKKIAA